MIGKVSREYAAKKGEREQKKRDRKNQILEAREMFKRARAVERARKILERLIMSRRSA